MRTKLEELNEKGTDQKVPNKNRVVRYIMTDKGLSKIIEPENIKEVPNS